MLALPGMLHRASESCWRTRADRQVVASAWIAATSSIRVEKHPLHNSGNRSVTVDWRISLKGVMFRFFDNLLKYTRIRLKAQSEGNGQAGRTGPPTWGVLD